MTDEFDKQSKDYTKSMQELKAKRDVAELKRIINGDNFPTLDRMFFLQQMYQMLVLGKESPSDSVSDFHYSMSALVCEIGEVLQADKRWKTLRNDGFDKEAKLEELVDCFAFLINAALFSGFKATDIRYAFVKKVKKNFERSNIEL